MLMSGEQGGCSEKNHLSNLQHSWRAAEGHRWRGWRGACARCTEAGPGSADARACAPPCHPTPGPAVFHGHAMSTRRLASGRVQGGARLRQLSRPPLGWFDLKYGPRGLEEIPPGGQRHIRERGGTHAADGRPGLLHGAVGPPQPLTAHSGSCPWKAALGQWSPLQAALASDSCGNRMGWRWAWRPAGGAASLSFFPCPSCTLLRPMTCTQPQP